MQRAIAVVRRAGVVAARVIDQVTLDHESRHRRRLRLCGEQGTEFLLDLEQPVRLEDGDALELEDGRLVLVCAAPQELLEVRAADPHTLLRIAWHIGNRHTPAEIGPEALLIEYDHVLADMVRGLGGRITPVVRPFQPEGGAYAAVGSGHTHHHN